MTSHKKIYLFDRFGINAFWERTFSRERLQVISRFSGETLRAIHEEDAILVFVNDRDLEEFMMSGLLPEAEGERVKFLDDVPELSGIGFDKYHEYNDLLSVPGVCVLGDSETVCLHHVVYVSSDSEAEDIRFISLGGEITGHNVFLRGGRIKVVAGEGSRLIFGNNCRIGQDVTITLEKNCLALLGDDCNLCDGTSIFLRSSSVVRIGDNCTLARVSVDAFREISMGFNCVVAREVNIRDGDGHDILGLDGPNYPEKIVIGNNVWLGGRVSVLKGVELGDYCIVGNGSIVSKSFAPHSLIAGVPAKVIKKGVSWRPDYSFYREMQEVAATHNWPFI
ncbi:MAG: DapH/DapD/GlmU-related protein [Nitrospirota bacterium]